MEKEANAGVHIKTSRPELPLSAADFLNEKYARILGRYNSRYVEDILLLHMTVCRHQDYRFLCM